MAGSLITTLVGIHDLVMGSIAEEMVGENLVRIGVPLEAHRGVVAAAEIVAAVTHGVTHGVAAEVGVASGLSLMTGETKM